MLTLIGGCIDQPPGMMTAQREQLVIADDPPRLIAVHGRNCTARIPPGEVASLADSLRLPPWATEATVLLNGWFFGYEAEDQHVAAAAVRIGDVKRSNGALTWTAVGHLMDRDHDDDHRWCYVFTAIAWNAELIDARPVWLPAAHDAGEAAHAFADDNDANSTALKARFHLIETESDGSAAVLPAGFGLRWDAGDHHLLQAAHDMGPPSRIVEAGRFYVDGLPDVDTSEVSNNAITWISESIMKDNAPVREYDVAEGVSTLAGRDVALLVPPFAILPMEKRTTLPGCTPPPGGEQVRDIVIRNVPFEFAFPVLTGWSLGFGCTDQHVSRIGIRVDSPSYSHANSRGGTLRYRVRSILTDQDGVPGHHLSLRMAILGFVPMAVAPQPSSDETSATHNPNRQSP